MRAPTGLLLMIVLCAPAPARAQPVSAFERLGEVINAGDDVRVVGWSGNVITGRVAGLSADAIALAREGGATERVPRMDVREVSTRRHDSVGNGALIGFASVAIPYCAAVVSRGSAAQCGLATAFLGGLGAAAGALVDAAISRRVVVFRATHRSVGVSVWPGRGGRGGVGVGAMARW